MSTAERRAAARANQRAAAFIRFQMLGDHEAMHFLLTDAGTDETGRLAFVTALASIAGTVSTQSMGRDGALNYLRLLAENSAPASTATRGTRMVHTVSWRDSRQRLPGGSAGGSAASVSPAEGPAAGRSAARGGSPSRGVGSPESCAMPLR